MAILDNKPGELEIVLNEDIEFTAPFTFYSDEAKTTTFDVSGADISAGIMSDYGDSAVEYVAFSTTENVPTSGGVITFSLTRNQVNNLKTKIKNNTVNQLDRSLKFLGYWYVIGKFKGETYKTKKIQGKVWYRFK